MTEALDRANASLRRLRGGVVFGALLWLGLLAMLLTGGFRTFTLDVAFRQLTTVRFWLTVSFVALMTWLMVRDALRAAAVTLTSAGIEQRRAAGSLTMRWEDVTEVTVARYNVAIRDRYQNVIRFSLLYASSANDVLEGIQTSLPSTARLRVR